jgi:hypothetical protein
MKKGSARLLAFGLFFIGFVVLLGITPLFPVRPEERVFVIMIIIVLFFSSWLIFDRNIFGGFYHG